MKTATRNEYVEVDRFDSTTGLEPLPKVWDLQRHGKFVQRFLRHADALSALDASEGRGWAVASVHPDTNPV